MEIKFKSVVMSNIEMKQHLRELSFLLPQRNFIGYIAAKNTRILTNALSEYDALEKEAISRYGTEDVDDFGHPIGTKTIKIGSPEYDAFVEYMQQYMDISQKVYIAVTSYESTINILSGEEILSVEWMLTEDLTDPNNLQEDTEA